MKRYQLYLSAMEANRVHRRVADCIDGLTNTKQRLVRRHQNTTAIDSRIARLRQTLEKTGHRYSRRYAAWINS